MVDYLASIAEQIEGFSAWVPTWVVIVVLYALVIGLVLALHKLVYRLAWRATADWNLFWRSLLSRTELLVRLTMVALGLMLATYLAPLDSSGTVLAGQVLLVLVIALVAMAARTALNIWTVVYLRRFQRGTDDNLHVRKHVTQIRILKRVADTLIVVIAIGAMLMSFESVRQYGVSLLASAGAAGIVTGLALQPLLKNLFAGIQLAITQPIRIDDVLVVEGEWVRVEEITSTYVVVRVWDMRRLILPLSYFIEQPFQNWTREGTEILGYVILYLDYQAPVDDIRAKAEEIARESKLWDGKVFSVQVVDAEQSTMKVRILMSAHNSSDAWDLRCLMREKIISYLQREHPESLPRSRTLVVGRAKGDDMLAAAADQGIEGIEQG